MIEVEKRFRFDPKDKARLIEGAWFEKGTEFVDLYFDTAGYHLTSKDWWLRRREGKLELKVPAGEVMVAERTTNRYRELTTEDEIRALLGLPKNLGLPHEIYMAGIRPFAIITTRRETWIRDGFTLDFDEADFGYAVFEVQLMVERDEDIADAERRIQEFAARSGLETANGHRGKVVEYLFRFRQEHYVALARAGVVTG